jgi:hypothetical protein
VVSTVNISSSPALPASGFAAGAGVLAAVPRGFTPVESFKTGGRLSEFGLSPLIAGGNGFDCAKAEILATVMKTTIIAALIIFILLG